MIVLLIIFLIYFQLCSVLHLQPLAPPATTVNLLLPRLPQKASCSLSSHRKSPSEESLSALVKHSQIKPTFSSRLRLMHNSGDTPLPRTGKCGGGRPILGEMKAKEDPCNGRGVIGTRQGHWKMLREGLETWARNIQTKTQEYSLKDMKQDTAEIKSSQSQPSVEVRTVSDRKKVWETAVWNLIVKNRYLCVGGNVLGNEVHTYV